MTLDFMFSEPFFGNAVFCGLSFFLELIIASPSNNWLIRVLPGYDACHVTTQRHNPEDHDTILTVVKSPSLTLTDW